MDIIVFPCPKINAYLLTSIDKHSSVVYSTRRYQQTINHMHVHIFFQVYVY